MPETLTEPDTHRDAARALFRAHGRAVRAFLSARVSDPASVEDLLQETFVVALARGVPAEHPGRWLLGVARNKLLHHLRDRRDAAPAIDLPAPTPGPADRSSAAEERARVRRAVAALEPDLREVIALRYQGGLTYREIAAQLDLPWTTVQGRLKRARIALRAALHPLADEEAP